MATYTSYYNLTKPEGTERVNIGIINQNMDSIDAQMYKNAQSIIANHGGMAIVSKNNTHSAVSEGQYVYVYKHSSLSEGLYVAKSAISTNGALSLSNLTEVTGGGLNHVYNTLNSKLTLQTLNNVAFIRYTDGRIQQKFYNGNVQEIFTIDPNKHLTMSHSDDGSTFQVLWNVSTEASRETKSIVEQSNFRISSGVIAQAIKRGNIAEFNTVIQCDSPFNTFPGTPIFTNLPIPYANGNTYVFFDINSFDTAGIVPVRLALAQDGTLYARYGEIGKAYDVHIVYLTV